MGGCRGAGAAPVPGQVPGGWAAARLSQLKPCRFPATLSLSYVIVPGEGSSQLEEGWRMLSAVTSRGGWGQQTPRARGRGTQRPDHGHGGERRVSQADNLLFSILLHQPPFFFPLAITEPANGSQPSP